MAAGILFAGKDPEWSGAGPFIAPSLTVFAVHARRMHLGLQLRGAYATLPFGVPSNDQKSFYWASVGITALFY